MSGSASAAAAATFLWLGMVLAISFLEAPLKFRAPGVTVRIGLGIGRLVFKALNTVESLLVVVIAAAVLVDVPAAAPVVALAAAAIVLALQLLLVRPRLARRSNAVLSGDESAPRSSAHVAYAGLEVVKALTLLLGGILLFATA